MPSAPLVCLGLTTLDVVHRASVLPTPGTKGWADDTELTAGGPAANAAVAAAALGRPVVLVTSIGTGPAADVARHDLAEHGVRVVDLAARSAAGPPVASCVVTPDGERTVVSPGARTSTVRLTAEAADVVREASVLLVDGHHPIAAEEALALTTGLRVLDAGSAKPHVEPWLERLDVVAGSADYARGLGLDLDAALRHVLDRGAGAAVMTDGAGAVRWAGPDTHGRVAVKPVRAVDTLGAGDAFHGALAAGLAAGRPLPDAVRLAARVATVRVQHLGARGWLCAIDPADRVDD